MVLSFSLFFMYLISRLSGHASCMNCHFDFLSRWYCLDRTGERTVVSDQNRSLTSFSKEELFKEEVSHRTTKLRKCQEVSRLQELQDQGAVSSGTPSFFHCSHLHRASFLLSHGSQCYSVRQTRSATAPEAFCVMASAASRATNQTLSK